VDSNTEQDSVLGSNDIWKKSYGNLASDNAKVNNKKAEREVPSNETRVGCSTKAQDIKRNEMSDSQLTKL
jgi:hypothetical protein